MDAIATATGLGKGSLYGAFGGKHALFLRVFSAYCDGVAASAASEFEGPDDRALERLAAYIGAVARAASSDGGRGCLLAKGAAELPTNAKAAQALTSAPTGPYPTPVCQVGADRGADPGT